MEYLVGESTNKEMKHLLFDYISGRIIFSTTIFILTTIVLKDHLKLVKEFKSCVSTVGYLEVLDEE